MGNWMTVNIVGTCDKAEVGALVKECQTGTDYGNFHCLSFGYPPSLCGLGCWPGENISAIGNLADRDSTPEDVSEQLRKLSEAAPSLAVRVHCGGAYESTECVCTISLKSGVVEKLLPEIKTLMSIPKQQIQANLLRCLMMG